MTIQPTVQHRVGMECRRCGHLMRRGPKPMIHGICDRCARLSVRQLEGARRRRWVRHRFLMARRR